MTRPLSPFRLRLGVAGAALALLVPTVAAAPSGAAGPAAARAAWSYDLPDLAPDALRLALDRLAARGVTRLFLSVEDGPRFRLDAAAGRAGLGRVVAEAERRGLAVEAMLLQHSRWLDDAAEAHRRISAAAAYGSSPGERPFAGLHLDVEPYTEDAWECGGETGRERLLRRLADLAVTARRVASRARGHAVPVSLAAPWWILDPEPPGGASAARALLAAADLVVLMAYGEPGGPLVGGDADRLLCRIGLPDRLEHLPGPARVAVGLAAYEYADDAALGQVADRIDARLGGLSRYAGSALFLGAAPPDAPLAVSIRGRVVGRDGRPVRGASVMARAAGTGKPASAVTNACGRFVVRLFAPGESTLVAAHAGLGTGTLRLAGLVAGREREVGAIVLDAAGGAAGAAAMALPDPALPPSAGRLARARGLAADGDYDGAAAAYRSLLARWPALLDARLGLARVDAWRGRHERAASAYRAILADRCDAAEAHLGLGDLARWAGRHDDAARHYGAVAAGWPHEPAGYLGLARSAADRGEEEEAIPLVERALALDPSDAEARRLLDRLRRR